jgi:hypothetical protein
VLRTKKDLCRLPCTRALYISWYCVLCCEHIMVLCFVLRTRHRPCQSCVLCVLVQGMVLHDQIENPWISLTPFYTLFGHHETSYENHEAPPGHIFENPCISLTFFYTSFGHHQNSYEIMGQHLVIISRSSTLLDTLTLGEDPGVSEYLSEYVLLCQSA